jgi:phosphoenolpyruvate-protein kinase (PTS system EI component)
MNRRLPQAERQALVDIAAHQQAGLDVDIGDDGGRVEDGPYAIRNKWTAAGLFQTEFNHIA